MDRPTSKSLSYATRSIRKWPAQDRPQERLVHQGPSALSDSELLAIVFRTGNPGARSTAVDVARELVARFGSLRRLADAPVAELRNVPGIGEVKAAQVHAALELGRRFSEERLSRGSVVSSSRDVYGHFRGRIRSLSRETVHVLMLDAKNRIVGEQQVSEGSLSASIVHPREVFRSAIAHSAASVILVHNHPSGDPAPSQEDRAITRRLREAGDLLGIRLLDHLIVATEGYVSFLELGALTG